MHSEIYQKDQKFKLATSTGTTEGFNDYPKSSRCAAMVETSSNWLFLLTEDWGSGHDDPHTCGFQIHRYWGTSYHRVQSKRQTDLIRQFSAAKTGCLPLSTLSCSAVCSCCWSFHLLDALLGRFSPLTWCSQHEVRSFICLINKLKESLKDSECIKGGEKGCDKAGMEWLPAAQCCREVPTHVRQYIKPRWLNMSPPPGISTLFLQAAQPRANDSGLFWVVQDTAVHVSVQFRSSFQECGWRQQYCNHLLRRGVHRLSWVVGFDLGLQDIFHWIKKTETRIY